MQQIKSVCRLQHICFTFTMCCLVLVISSCSDLVTTSITSATSVQRTPYAKVEQAPNKSDSASTEAISRSEQAKLQKIMAGMSLDQKLGQLIVVEYLGNNYQGQDGGLQYMISQQYVGGFMYQESNSNFDAPYNVVSNVATLSQQAMHDASIPLLIAT